jgi:hypothetical protein
MVAFEQPHHAVQWCLAVQVCAGRSVHVYPASRCRSCRQVLRLLFGGSCDHLYSSCVTCSIADTVSGVESRGCTPGFLGTRSKGNNRDGAKYIPCYSCALPHHPLQEALLYEQWEPAVLRHPGFEPVTCPDSGRLLFAGPRLRMGLAEGAPHSVAPDHSGRANYSVSCFGRLWVLCRSKSTCDKMLVVGNTRF